MSKSANDLRHIEDEATEAIGSIGLTASDFTNFNAVIVGDDVAFIGQLPKQLRDWLFPDRNSSRTSSCSC